MSEQTLDDAVLAMLGSRLVDLIEKLDGAVLVLPAGGAVFIRSSAKEGFVDRVPHEVEIKYGYPDGKDGRRVVSGVKVKEIPPEGHAQA